MICEHALTIDLGFVYTATGIGFGATAFIIAIAYMLGKFFDNPRLIIWAKDELPQLFLTAIFVLIIISILNIGLTIPVKELSSITPFPVQKNADLCAYDFAERYLDNASTYAHNTMKLTRIYLYMSEFISSMWKQTHPACIDSSGEDKCESAWDVLEKSPRWGACAFGLTCLALNSFTSAVESGGASFGEIVGGVTAAWLYLNYCLGVDTGIAYIPKAWVGMISSILTTQLHTTSLAILLFLAQKYLLHSFLTGGFIAIIPLALILRSIPFMRRIGGILLGIGVGFIVIFPIFLVIEGLVFTQWDMDGFKNEEAADFITSKDGLDIKETDPYFKGKTEWKALVYKPFDYSFKLKSGKIFLCKTGQERCSVSLDSLLAYGAVSFLLSSFLLSLNFIGTAAGIVGIGKVFGEEIDIARFLRMV